MPNRIIKESINEDRELNRLSPFAQDLFKRLITYGDDYGRFNADIEMMRVRLYPREIDTVTLEDLDIALTELSGESFVQFYTSTARKEIYGCMPKWEEHQRVRDSRQKIPEPGDTSINDWYLRRFIPTQMKEDIFRRDDFTCQECKESHKMKKVPARRAMRLLQGALHIDHIVPVSQGGRATMDNLRVLCAGCNFSRKRAFTPKEILEEFEKTRDLRQVAETCGESPPESNPIQFNPESESISTQPSCYEFDDFWDDYDKKKDRAKCEKKWKKVTETDRELIQKFIPIYKKHQPDDQFRKNPITFLNQETWMDDWEAYPPKEQQKLMNHGNNPNRKTKGDRAVEYLSRS